MSDNSLKSIQKEMQKMQQEFFDFQLSHPVNWLEKKWLTLEERFVRINNIPTRAKWGRKLKAEDHITREEIFNGKARRILIESHLSYDKTIFVSNLISDWSKAKKYIRDKFVLVFVIPLRLVTDDISSCFLHQCKLVKGTDQEKLQAIEEIEGRVLLILDKLHDCSEEVRKNLLPLIEKKQYPNMTVIVTCRTCYMASCKRKGYYYDKRCMDSKHFVQQITWDKKILMEDNEKLLNFFNDRELDKIRRMFSKLNMNYRLHCSTVIFLVLKNFIDTGKDIEAIGTKTVLFGEIINFILKSLIERNVSEELSDFDIFDLNKNQKIRQVLIHFGKLCLEKIKNHSLTFGKCELIGELNDVVNEIIFKLGLLSKEISFFNYGCEEYYEPMERRFVEFFAAFYLSSLDEGQLGITLEELFLKYNIGPRENQLLYPFLGGLMQADAFKFINVFSNYSGLISTFHIDYIVYSFQDVLLEILPHERTVKSLATLLHADWNRIEYKEFLHDWYVVILNHLMEQGMSDDVSFKIPQQVNLLKCLPEGIKINKLLVNVEDLFKKTGGMKLNVRNIQCRILIIDSKGIFVGLSAFVKDLTAIIEAENIEFHVSYLPLKGVFSLDSEVVSTENENIINFERDNFNNFQQELVSGVLQGVCFWYLILEDIAPYFLNLLSPCIQHLITNEIIEYGLDIKFTTEVTNNLIEDQFLSLIDSISNSHLKSFSLFNYRLEVLPFPLGLFASNKPWDFIKINGKFAAARGIDELESPSIEHFDCLFTMEDKHFLQKLLMKCENIKQMTCRDIVISQLIENDFMSTWKGFESVERLNLMIQESKLDTMSFLEGISLFKHVREIYFQYVEDSDDSEFFVEIISRLPSLEKVILNNDLQLEFLQRLLNSIDSNRRNEKCLQELEIHGYCYEELNNKAGALNLISCLETCFAKTLLLKITSSANSVWIIEEPFKYFLSKKICKSCCRHGKTQLFMPLKDASSSI